MTGDAIPIYGSLQYPHMDLFALHNPVMDINKTISTNLAAMLIGYDLVFSNTSGFSSRWEIECTSNSRTNYTAAINRLVL